jgi:hypothetical protein
MPWGQKVFSGGTGGSKRQNKDNPFAPFDFRETVHVFSLRLSPPACCHQATRLSVTLSIVNSIQAKAVEPSEGLNLDKISSGGFQSPETNEGGRAGHAPVIKDHVQPTFAFLMRSKH